MNKTAEVKRSSLGPNAAVWERLTDGRQVCERVCSLRFVFCVQLDTKPRLCDIIPPVYSAVCSQRGCGRHSNMEGGQVNPRLRLPAHGSRDPCAAQHPRIRIPPLQRGLVSCLPACISLHRCIFTERYLGLARHEEGE